MSYASIGYDEFMAGRPKMRADGEQFPKPYQLVRLTTNDYVTIGRAKDLKYPSGEGVEGNIRLIEEDPQDPWPEGFVSTEPNVSFISSCGSTMCGSCGGTGRSRKSK